MLGPSCRLEQAWSRIYLSIINLQHQVEFQRQIDVDFNVPLFHLQGTLESWSMLLLSLIRDYKDRGPDGQYFEFLIKYGILGQTVDLAIKDIPNGLLDHVVSTFGAMLVHMPGDVFLHERISEPTKRLLSTINNNIKSLNNSFVESFMQAFVSKLGANESLINIFSDCRAYTISLFRYFIGSTNFLSSEIYGSLLEAISIGFLTGFETELNDLALELTFKLINAFCLGSDEEFVTYCCYLGKLYNSASHISNFPLTLLYYYQRHFVDRIYVETLKDSSPKDGNFATLLDKLLFLVISSAEDTSDLVIILINKTIQVLDEKNFVDISKADRFKLIQLCGYVLAYPKLQCCFPKIKPTVWKESFLMHHSRLEAIFSLLLSNVNLSSMQIPSVISEFYKSHLSVLDSFLISGYEISRYDEGNLVPIIKETFVVIDRAKNQFLVNLYLSAKNDIIEIWTMPLRVSIAMIKFILLVLAFSDSTDLYSEYIENDPQSFFTILQDALNKASPIQLNEDLIEPIFRKHMCFDVFDASIWDPSVFSKDTNVVVSYLLAHTLLRLAAIVHTRAIRPPTKIFYE